jgi:heptosyltransferase I
MKRILVVRMGAMGDIIHTLPAVASLKRAFPATEIDWVVEKHWAPLLMRNRHLSQLHVVETRTWRKQWGGAGTWRMVLESLGKLRSRQYDCALDFQGLLKSAVLARLSGARRVVGFDRGELREGMAALFYTQRLPEPPRGQRVAHVVERNLALAAAVGATERVIEFCCAPSDADAQRARELVGGLQRYVVISPSAGWPAKRWPAERYAELARLIHRELGLPVVINCGPGEDAVAANIARLAGEAQPVVVRPSVGELIALVRDAALLVGGDTGPLHLAIACDTPVVAIFGATDPARNGPYGLACRVVRAPGVRTTYSRSADQRAIRGVTVEQVARAAAELLGAP